MGLLDLKTSGICTKKASSDEKKNDKSVQRDTIKNANRELFAHANE